MRTKIIVTMLLAATACSKPIPTQDSAGQEAPTAAADQARSVSPTGPDVGPTLVPGLALAYDYSFRLPIGRVQQVQEQHASQCEALGPARCRIVSMEYHAGQSRSITASLGLKLAPELARRFGRQGVATVAADGGMLSDARIEGTEVGAGIEAQDRGNRSMSAEEQQLGAELARPGLGTQERMQLQARLQGLRDSQRGTEAEHAAAILTLASTPVHFSYVSGDVDPGYTDGPIRGALRDGWSNIVSGSAVLLLIVITLLPWALALLLAIWLVRRYGTVLLSKRTHQE